MPEVYTHGHHESVLRSHRWRTAENSAAYLVLLDKVTAKALREALTDGWLACAPRALADRYAQGEVEGG